ncbi:MAG: transposase [Clostridia bacterium]|nr:transposase [Clostridia bacterium]
MQNNEDVLPKRKPIRLKGYDYSSVGAYHITICTKDKKMLFWNNVGATFGRPNNQYQLSSYGEIAKNEIEKINTIYDAVRIDKYVVMPNHIHIIISIVSDEFGRPQVAPTIPRIIQQFKGAVSKKIGFSVWQKGYNDHIIRGQQDYDEIWQYIDENPLRWVLKKDERM